MANAVKIALEANGNVDDSVNCCRLQRLKAAFPDNLEFALGKVAAEDEKDFNHFIVCDHDMVRDEEYHGDVDADSPASKIKAEVCFWEPHKAKAFDSRFDSFWSAVTSH